MCCLQGFKILLQDLEPIKGVGAGTSGVVQKVRHRPSGQLLVLKAGRSRPMRHNATELGVSFITWLCLFTSPLRAHEDALQVSHACLQVINCNLRAEHIRKQVFGELRTLRSCRHCNIVRYHESFYDNGAVTIAMEYMDRGSLADVFVAFGHVPEHFLAMILAQV